MKLFTAREAAAVLHVAPGKVFKWITSGRLKGYRVEDVPGWKVPSSSIVQFARENAMPFDVLSDGRDGPSQVLLVARDSGLIGEVQKALPSRAWFNLVVAQTGFEAGVQLVESHADCVIVDFDVGHELAMEICQGVRHGLQLADPILIAFPPSAGQNGFDAAAIDALVDELFERPIDEALLAQHVEILVDARRMKPIH